MPFRKPKRSLPLHERFWPKVDTRSGECWEWRGATKGNGYGHMSIPMEDDGARRTEFAHRVSWRIHFGDIPDGLVVCHTCDNPLCVRPWHLFLGTMRENSADMLNKGRWGGRHPRPEGAPVASGQIWNRVTRQITCIAGHPNIPENRDSRGRCIHCARRRNKESAQRRRDREKALRTQDARLLPESINSVDSAA